MSHYRLRGEVEGEERSFPLTAGEQTVGSLPNSALSLSATGVSRQHAKLLLRGERLEVEDLGSKNGTFLNDQKVSRATARVGDQLRFGPVQLLFEEQHRDDAQLAIAIAPTPSPSISLSSFQVQETPLVSSGLGGALTKHWLQVAEAFLAYLPRRGGDLRRAVQVLLEHLHLQAVWVMELEQGQQPVVLAASGQVDEDTTETLTGAILDLPGQRRQDEFSYQKLDPPDSLPLSIGALYRPDGPLLVLALSGTFGGRSEGEPLLRLLLRLLERGTAPQEARSQGQAQEQRFPDLVVPEGFVFAQSESMRRLYGLMQSLAQGDLPVLIIGETGAGKEYLAQILHASSPRSEGPFEAINCAAIPAELLEAELFGIGEGVATGVSPRKGRFQLASGGTLFLDEIGDMSAGLQAKLLRALQEKEVHPVGQRPVKVDVRVLAATNQQLSQRIREGSFRSDLYYRLAGYVLEIPPLRERPEDIPSLVEHFLRRGAKELSKSIRGLTVRALRMLVDYPWPGNVRELENEVRQVVYLCPESQAVDSGLLSQTIREHAATATGKLSERVLAGAPIPSAHRNSTEAATPSVSSGTAVEPAPALVLHTLDLETVEELVIRAALERAEGNQVQAARLLGITRQKLRRRMQRFGQL